MKNLNIQKFEAKNLNPRHHRTDMTRQQAYALMVECVKEVFYNPS